jgi:hypothetical protein
VPTTTNPAIHQRGAQRSIAVSDRHVEHAVPRPLHAPHAGLAAQHFFLGDEHIRRAGLASAVPQNLRQLPIRLRLIAGALKLEPPEPRVGVCRATRELIVDEAIDRQHAGSRPARLIVPQRVGLRILQIELGAGRMLDVDPVECPADQCSLGVEARLGRATEARTVDAQRLPDAREPEIHDPVGGEAVVEDRVAGDRRFDGVDGRVAAAEKCAARAIEVAADSRTKEAEGAVRAETNRQIARHFGQVSGDRTRRAAAYLEALQMRERQVDPVGNVAAYQRDRRVCLHVRQIERSGDSRSGDPQATRIDQSARIGIGIQPSEKAGPDAPLGSPMIPERRVIRGIVGVRVWANPGQLAPRRTAHDDEFSRAEGVESGAGEVRDPLGLLRRAPRDGCSDGQRKQEHQRSRDPDPCHLLRRASACLQSPRCTSGERRGWVTPRGRKPSDGNRATSERESP